MLNHCWKNKLNVGVRTSARVSSENPAARSWRNGSRSAADRHPGCFREGVWLDAARLLWADPSGVSDRSRGRNSAGPRGFLTSAMDGGVCLPVRLWEHGGIFQGHANV